MKKEIKGKQNILLKRENIVLMFMLVLIFIIHMIHISKLGIIYVLNDEFGYWGNAAYFAGHDWSSTVSRIGYYSYGYSILLIPLFRIFENPMYMYKAAIVLNAVMLCGSFLICYNIAKKLSKGINEYVLMTISFLIAMYPAYIVNANVAWSECTLIFVCWLMTWCFLGLNKSTSNFKLILLGVLSGFVYVIHQRALGILIASVIVIIIMKIYKKINLKQFITLILTIVVLLLIHHYVKSDIQHNLYLSSSIMGQNDFYSQIEKVKKMFTIDGFINIIRIFAGQFFYLGASSCLLCYFGIYEIVRRIGPMLGNIIKNKTLNNDDNVYAFLLLALFSSIAISVVFMSNPNRIDQLVYGRYTEMILGPIILVGFLNFLGKDKIPVKDFIFVLISFIFLTIITNLILTVFGFNSYNSICAIGLIVKPNVSNNYNVYISAFISIAECILIYISSNKRNILFPTLICICCIYFSIGEEYVVLDMLGNGKYGIEENIQDEKITNFIKSSVDELPVYFLLTNDINGDRQKNYLQFLLKDRKLICVTKDELNSIVGDKFVVVGGYSSYLFELLNEYEFCLTAADSHLFVSRTSSIANEIGDQVYSKGFVIPLDSFYRINCIDSDIIQGNGTVGIFMYGPYISLESGNYKITVELELVDAVKEELGFVDVVAGQNQFYKQEINVKSFDENNKLIIEIPLKLEDYTDNIELRAYAYDGTRLKIDNVSIQK